MRRGKNHLSKRFCDAISFNKLAAELFTASVVPRP